MLEKARALTKDHGLVTKKKKKKKCLVMGMIDWLWVFNGIGSSSDDPFEF